MILSANFDLDEMTRSQTALRLGVDNTPSPMQIDEMKRLCADLLEPIRVILGVPLHVDSGYRSPAVNAAVGGVGTSAHLFGRAADIVPVGLTLRDAFEKIRTSSLPYDQVIIECNAWIHVGAARMNAAPRREAMTASGSPGHWSYQLVPQGLHA